MHPILYALLGLGGYAWWRHRQRKESVRQLAPPPPGASKPTGRPHYYEATIQRKGQRTIRKRYSIPATNRNQAKQKLLGALANQFPGATVGLRFLRVG